MLTENSPKKLNKSLGLLDVFTIALGTTISAGFFLLPGLAAQVSGPAMVLAYVIAAIPLIPAMLSKIELATAMPKAGGVYFFLDRALGPFFGTIGGLGIWLTLILKVAFALVGMGAYIKIFLPGIPLLPVALGIAVLLTILNLFGVKKSGNLQIFLVAGLLVLLFYFISGGVSEIKPEYFEGFFDAGIDGILSTAGLVYISYVGVTKVASLAEEIKNPERNLPLGVFTAIFASLIIYVLGTTIVVGVEPMDILKGDLTPIATSAKIIFGRVGEVLLSIAALFAFLSVANVGMLSASRYPLAMSRDHIFPETFRRLNKGGVPHLSVLLTAAIVFFLLIVLDPMSIAKLASAFQLLVFALLSFAVIVMRESKIESYDPGYLSPLYPWTQIIGIITSLILIVEMGALSMLFSTVLIVVCILWYWFYARKRVVRNGAIYHVFERLGRQRYDELDSELRGILKEKGLRKDDPFEEVVSRAKVLDLQNQWVFEDVVKEAANWLSKTIPLTQKEIYEHIMEGTRIGATPVTRGVALPHFRAKEVTQTEMILVRAKDGVKIKIVDPITHAEEDEKTVNALFFLVSPESNPSQHLRMLAQIAGRVEDESFANEWEVAQNEMDLKQALLHDDRFLSVTLSPKNASSEFIGKRLKEITLPSGCLVPLLTRDNLSVIPNGNTKLLQGDKLLIIGEIETIQELKKTLS